MATKKKTATKAKTASAAKKKVAPAKAKKTTSRKVNMPIGIYKEKCPENHIATGKYVFFYALFATTTVFFAILAVWLFVFSSELLNKYQELDSCTRNGQTTNCVEKHSIHNDNVDVTVNDDDEEKN